jgi:DNA-binding PadR family transcriptional regulator
MQYLLMAMLGKGPAHGYQLKRQVDALLPPGARPVNIGQVYGTLRRLARDGLVTGRRVGEDGHIGKTVYELAEAGREQLRRWFESADESERSRDDLYSRIVLAAESGLADPARLIDRQRRAHLQALRDLHLHTTLGAGGAAGLGRLLVEGAALRIEAELKWLDLCERALTGVKVSP